MTNTNTDNLFDPLLKKHNSNCEIFTSRVKISECPVDKGASYIRSADEKGYSIRSLHDSRLGTSSSNIFEKKAAEKTMKLSIDAAKRSNKLPPSFSFTDTEGISKPAECFDPKISKNMDSISTELAQECIQMAEESKIHLTNGKVRLIEFEYTIRNSLGIEKNEKGTYIMAMIESKPETKKPVSELSSVYMKRMYDKSSFLSWFKDRLDLTGKYTSPKKLEGGVYDTIISPQVIGSLLTDTIGYWASGKSRVDGISVFAGKEKQEVADHSFSASDDPLYPDAPSTFGIDAEARKTKKTDIIKNGIFANYIYDNKYSSYFNTESTANSKKASILGSEKIYTSPTYSGLHNLVIPEGKEKLNSLIENFTGIFIDSVGIPSADRETGNFGFELRNAFLVKKGEMTPVRYGIYSGKVQDIIKNASITSKDRETVPDRSAPEFNSACVCPYFVLEKQHISGAK